MKCYVPLVCLLYWYSELLGLSYQNSSVYYCVQLPDRPGAGSRANGHFAPYVDVFIHVCVIPEFAQRYDLSINCRETHSSLIYVTSIEWIFPHL